MAGKNKNFIATLDFGGTFLKWSLASPEEPYSPLTRKYFSRTKINSQGSAGEILGVLTSTLETAFRIADFLKIGIRGIGISTPGPFDLGNGISLMKHKFGAIYGLNLKKEIKTRLNLEKNFPVRFIFDSTAFITGEAFFGAARPYNRIIGITLGTGIGSIFMADKKIIEKGRGLPPEGGSYLFNMPYEGGIVEDKISRKAIIDKYRQMRGKCPEDIDVDKISHMASCGDRISLEVFREFGLVLGRIIRIVSVDFKPECIVFGGGISKGFRLFSRPLKMQLKDIGSLKKITPCKLGDLSALYGVMQLFSQE